MYAKPEREAARKRNGWVNIYSPGDDFVSFLEKREAVIGGLMKELGFLRSITAEHEREETMARPTFQMCAMLVWPGPKYRIDFWASSKSWQRHPWNYCSFASASSTLG